MVALLAGGCAESRSLATWPSAGFQLTWQARAETTHRRWNEFEARYSALWKPSRGAERSFQIWIAASGSDHLLIDVTGRMGGSWLTVATRDGEMLAVLPRDREYVREPVSTGLLRNLSGWPLEPWECAGVLLADLPARLGLPFGPGRTHPDDDGSPAAMQLPAEITQIDPEQGNRARRYRFAQDSGENGNRATLQIEEAGKVVAQVHYLSWESQDGLPIPSHLHLKDAHGTLEMRLMTLDEGVAEGAFDLTPPDEFERRPARPGEHYLGGRLDPGAGS